MTRFVRLTLATCLLVIGSILPGVGALGQDHHSAFSLHPQNHRYFLFRGKPTVLVTSGEHYGLLLNRGFDFEAYFDELASHGLNHTRVFSGVYREVADSFGITQNTLAPTDEDFICPWQRSGKTHRDGSPIYDLEKWDEAYFERLAAMLKAASERGIVVEMCLFCPMYKPVLWDVNPMNIRNNVNEVGDCGSKEVYTTQHDDLLRVQVAVAEKMVEAFSPFDNVYIEICNEPYFGGVTEAWQRKMIDVVVAKQQDVGSQQLISVNVANKTKKIEDPHAGVSIFNFHYCHPPIVVAENSHVDGAIGENETGFRGQEDFLYRTEGWDFLVAGGATYNNLDYSFSVKHPAGTLTEYASPGGGSRALRAQLSILKSTFDQLPIPELRPQPDRFVQAPEGFVASAIGKPGLSYLVYLHVAMPGRLQDQPAERFTRVNKDLRVLINLPRGTYRIKQIDTKSGDVSSLIAIEVNADELSEIAVSAFETDAGLLIESQQ